MRASEQAKRAGQGREEAARSMGLAADLAPVEILAVDLQTPTLRSYIATYVRLMAEFYRHVAASPPHQLRGNKRLALRSDSDDFDADAKREVK